MLVEHKSKLLPRSRCFTEEKANLARDVSILLVSQRSCRVVVPWLASPVFVGVDHVVKQMVRLIRNSVVSVV